MNFTPFLYIRLPKRRSPFVGVSLLLVVMVLVLVPRGFSQQPRPPAWSVQAADPTHGLLTLRGSVMVGIDTGMFYLVEFRIQGSSANQLGSFQTGMAVTLASSASKLQPPTTLGSAMGSKSQRQTGALAKSPTTSAVFTGIPTVGQALLIQASGLSPLDGVVASVTGPQSYTAGSPPPACCTVTAFDAQTGAVRAQVNASGQIFMFQAPMREGPPPGPGQPPPYQALSIGQHVWANLTTGEVSLDGRTMCCKITAEGISLPGSGGKPTTGGNRPIAKAPACCEITALNQQAKTASAKVKSNGQAFQIAVANPILFQSLRVGHAIWANFKTRQISLNGVGPIDGIQIVGSPNVSGPLIAKLPGTTFTGKKPPYTAIPSPNSPPLTIHDHTLLMQAVIQNRAYVKQGISRHSWQHATRRQIAMAAMLYLIKATTVPEPTKERARVAYQAMRNLPPGTANITDATFRKDAAAALRAASDPSSALQMLSNLEQEYGTQPKYLTALKLAKTLLSDGASTIYSPMWVTKNLQRPTSGGLVNYDIPLACGSGGGPDDPSGADSSDLGNGCFSGGCDPFTDPTCGCDPATDPTCGCDPATDPNCGPPPPPPDCISDPSNPDCPPPPPIPEPGPTPTPTPTPTCPDPNNPVCNNPVGGPGYCTDPTNPKCHWTADTLGIMDGSMEMTLVIGSDGQVKQSTLKGNQVSTNGLLVGLMDSIGALF